MSRIRLSLFIIPALVASLSIFGLAQSARAQKVTICVDFSATDDITESDGKQSHISPSGLSAKDQATIISQVQALYEGVLGKGNVTVKNAADGPCNGKFVLIDSGEGPGNEYGDAQERDGTAVVHIGAFVKQGFKGDTLITAIGEGIAHEAGHLLGLSHNGDSTSIMVKGDSISVPRRMADHRKFTSGDSGKLIKYIAMSTVAPESGSFAVSAPELGFSQVPDDKATDIRLSTNNPQARLGYISTLGQFVGGWEVSPGANEYDYTFLGNQTLNYAIDLNGSIYSSLNYGTYTYADPVPSKPGVYAQGMWDIGSAAPGTSVFVNLPSSGESGGITPLSNYYYPQGPYGGNVIGHGHVNEFDVMFTPNYLDVEGYFEDYDTWYAPLGTEIVDAAFEDWGIDPFTGNAWATCWVMLDDGEMFLLGFETCEECHSTEGYTLDYLPPNPFFSGNAFSFIDGPITSLGSGMVTRYDSTHSKWVADTAGLKGAYVYTISGGPGGRIFAATSNGIFTQLNTSLSWTATSYPPGYTQSVFCDRSGRLYAYNNSGISHSSDNGTTWTPGPKGITPQYFVVSFGDDAFGNIYAITNNYTAPSRLFKLQLGTDTCVQIAQNVTAQTFNKAQGYTFNSISGDTDLYLCTKFGQFKSTDQGNTWKEDDDHVHSSSYYTIAKSQQGKLLLGTDNGVFSGYYRDTAWQKLWPTNGNITQYRVPLYVDLSGNTYTLGMPLTGYNNFGYANARSTDGGQTWTQDSSSESIVKGSGIYYADPFGKEYIATYGSSNLPLHIYSRLPNGAWVADQNGFVPSSAGNYPEAFGSDGTSTFMGVTDSNIGLLWRYTAGTWSLDTTGLHKDFIYSFGWDGTSIYAGGQYGIYKKTESGWASFPFPKDVPGGANPFYISADHSGAVFSTFFAQGSNGNYTTEGVYFTKDMGQHWTRANIANGIQINGLYSYLDSTYVLTTKGVFAFTSKQFARSYIPEGEHNNGSTTLHFGYVRTGTTSNIPIRITNFGNDTLHVTGLTSTNTAFTVTNVPGAAASGQVLHAQLQFSPIVDGDANAMIIIASNSIAGPDTIMVDGEAGIKGGGGVATGEPDAILSLENYPNPFASATTIEYSLANRERVTLKIFDVLGREVTTLVSSTLDAGPHTASFDTGDLPDGIYIATLRAGSAVMSREMTVVK